MLMFLASIWILIASISNDYRPAAIFGLFAIAQEIRWVRTNMSIRVNKICEENNKEEK